MVNKKVFAGLVVAILTSLHCYSEVITEENLSFGVFAIKNNSSISELSVSANGRTSTTNSIRVLRGGQAAQIRLVNYPLYTRLFISAILPQSSTVFAGMTEQFSINHVDMPETVITNYLGEAIFPLGATIETSGNGGAYLDTTYNFRLMLTVNY
ncbi:DUF4402 domain-containing protein [Paraglaciecola agarilytica]|uniref:DUF4402 domain-containing protein n=1 Tax=Paraglaciecola chathamensis TaxID=368405 RepID=UPI001C09422A|nr:DUF4402 domain-containing protein [Paraglaciecola agarilytica]MBU3016729.1 DUF4402 domain-containing protein [Paraglaciecola agarilytica]